MLNLFLKRGRVRESDATITNDYDDKDMINAMKMKQGG